MLSSLDSFQYLCCENSFNPSFLTPRKNAAVIWDGQGNEWLPLLPSLHHSRPYIHHWRASSTAKSQKGSHWGGANSTREGACLPPDRFSKTDWTPPVSAQACLQLLVWKRWTSHNIFSHAPHYQWWDITHTWFTTQLHAIFRRVILGWRYWKNLLWEYVSCCFCLPDSRCTVHMTVWRHASSLGSVWHSTPGLSLTQHSIHWLSCYATARQAREASTTPSVPTGWFLPDLRIYCDKSALIESLIKKIW